MTWPDLTAMGYHGELQSWSRVDYLMQQDKAKLGAFLWKLKSLPPATGPMPQEQLVAAQTAALQETFGLDSATFDAKWRDWVLATYPKK
jgi:hypothetical protein